ncbi:adenylate/guanylate cyclase domain-containing protein [Tomitella biformata]|uniref:adenylate/guanylate cyclase domain-containing protein n=1 Tax=Tomitella biformata TaxID=630403 RepID=UPI00057007EF|nr:adenylate/guanylate cyclase domain-containing protein [Tomitella biformata]
MWKLARWLLGTRWPIYAFTMLLANIVGALALFVCMKMLIPDSPITIPSSFTPATAGLFFGYLAFALVIGGIGGIYLVFPVLRWQRDKVGNAHKVRRRALRIPIYHAILHLALWSVGVALITLINVNTLGGGALTIAVAGALGAITTSAFGYLQAERILRPVAAEALSYGVMEQTNAPGVSGRILLTWVTCTGIPIFGTALMVAGLSLGILPSDSERVLDVVLAVCVITLVVGAISFTLIGSTIGDPIRQLREAQRKVQGGDLNTQVTIYDGGEIGLLQAGFNSLLTGLEERQRLRDLFGRYVGEDVARRALAHGTELGGAERYVAVLFVDLIGSTRLAATVGPEVVVILLNEFFREIVETVNHHGGFVNKFQGDAALAIFGAPLEHPDAPGAALAAARELRHRLDIVVGEGEFGIGVSAGIAIAGHVGAAARFEFTVIGDPVNEAARLTELAKNEPGAVLASARAVEDARAPEPSHWVLGETVLLRGRRAETRLGRPTC